ncbi:MAG: family 10 glycosylhydrolase [Clostridia bacterium]|nr:family 10 glycosylhydrolase [Clostridia bacterium]
MKRIIALFCALSLLCCALCACGGGEETSEAESKNVISEEVSDIMSEEPSEPVSETVIPTGDVVFEINGEKTEARLNELPSGSCVRVYSYEYGSVTPQKDGDFVEIEVKNRKISYVGAENERLIIMPDSFVISFCGDAASQAAGLSAGDRVIARSGNVATMPSDYAVIDGALFRITSADTARENRETVLYTPSYGESTRTSGGYEYVIENGEITAFYKSGDTDIPENGYVLSFGPKASRPSDGAKRAELHHSLAGYSVSKLEINAYNAVRQQDFLVIYSGKATTETNPYGYEVQVDKDGKCIGEVYGGNAAIPSGGYVISGHGENETALKEAYSYGARAVLDKTNDTVTITRTPQTEFDKIAEKYAEAKTKLVSMRETFEDIDHAACGALLEKIGSLIEQIEEARDAEEYIRALELCITASDALAELEFRMIPSLAVENRAAWYRSTEKSDSEVRVLLEKARSMNINALYIETFYYGYTIGNSSVPGIGHNPANGNYDALEGFCRLGKEYGIEIHAWVQNFCIGLTQNLAKEPDCLANTLPKEKRLVDRAGNDYFPLPSGGFVFLDPYDAENRALVLAVYEELLQNYDIAGIHLDYIRFPELNGENDYGYNDDIVNAFKAQSGYTGDLRKTDKNSTVYKDFCAFRREIITSFVGEVYDLVMRVKPRAWISVAAYPDTASARNTIFQDVKTWVNNGWIDEVFSMTYSSDNSYVLSNARQFVSFTGQKCFYSTGLSGFSGTRKEVFAYQFSAAREAGAGGESLFAITGKASETWLRLSEGYTRLMKYGAYSRPSVQTNRLNVTLKAQIEDFFRKKDELYGEAYVYSELLDPRLLALAESCASFEGGNFEEQYEFAKAALGELKQIYNDLKANKYENENSACRKKVLNDILQMRYCMERMMNRITARLPQ